MHFQTELAAALAKITSDIDAVGFITSTAKIYPLGSDTKVLSTVFELAVRPTILQIATQHGYLVEEPDSQNFYPDFTLVPQSGDGGLIAVDVKTTYRRSLTSKFWFTLGGYTSFLREETPAKNIVYPYDRYSSHWVIGFVYTRLAVKKAAEAHTYGIENISEIPKPYGDVDVFLQEKWRISGDRAGSGNTTNIGSISGHIEDFRTGNGIFETDEEFHQYWRRYGRTKSTREFSNIREFRDQKKGQS